MHLQETLRSGERGNNDAVSHSGGCSWHMFALPRCIIVAMLLTSSYPRHALKRREHRPRYRIVSLGCIHAARNTGVLSVGLIPAALRRATPSLSLHLLSAGLRTRRCDRHVRTP